MQEVTQRAYAIYLSRMEHRPAPMDADYERVLRAGESWVAEVDGEIIGAVVTRRAADHLHIDNIAVLPSAQGHGVGGQLLTTAENHVLACGLREVRLYTNEAMTENLAFYPRRGYQETGRAVDEGFRRVFFKKSLPATG